MTLPQSTIQRIADEADNISRIPEIQQGYQMGGEKEAERAQEIIDALQIALEKSVDGRITAEHMVRLAVALTKYNNSK